MFYGKFLYFQLHPLYYPQLMCSSAGNAVYNTLVIYFVNTHIAGCMDDCFAIQQNTYMRYPPLIIVKKSEVAALGFLQKANYLALRGLLVCIAQQMLVHKLKNLLGKATTVNAKITFAAP